MLGVHQADQPSLPNGWCEITTSQEIESLAAKLLENFYPQNELRLPPPHVTRDVSHATELACRSQKQLNYIYDLHEKVLSAIQQCEASSDHWFVLENIQHPWYRIDFQKLNTKPEIWPVELLPYGDPCYLLANDFRCGLIADVSGTISVFGKQFLEAVQCSLPDVLTRTVSANR